MRFFPDNRKFGWSSSKEQGWTTTTQTSASGKMRMITTQQLPSWKIKASYPALSDDEARELLGFYAQVKGQFEPFYWLDPEDNTCENRALAVISSDGLQYQATMQQGNYTEAVEYIDNVHVYVDGTEVYNYSVTDGVITFVSAPTGKVTASYRYYWVCVFKADSLTIEKIFENINKASFTLKVVR
jgi:hypothetical protein